MKKKLNTNIEVYNYLNLTNRKLGKLYKYTGTSCLPHDFDVNEEAFKERILLNEMQNSEIFPPFVNEDKKTIKKALKNSLKNIQKFKKYAKNALFLQNFSQKFIKKLSLYLELRHDLSHAFLTEFESQDCDEVEMYRQIFNLDPVFGEFFESFFEAKADFPALLENLEEKYEKSYLEKLQILEKKNEKRKKSAQKHLENVQNAQKLQREQKTNKKTQNVTISHAKRTEKSAKTMQKTQNLKDAKSVRAQNKQNLSKQNTKNKEKA